MPKKPGSTEFSNRIKIIRETAEYQGVSVKEIKLYDLLNDTIDRYANLRKESHTSIFTRPDGGKWRGFFSANKVDQALKGLTERKDKLIWDLLKDRNVGNDWGLNQINLITHFIKYIADLRLKQIGKENFKKTCDDLIQSCLSLLSKDLSTVKSLLNQNSTSNLKLLSVSEKEKNENIKQYVTKQIDSVENTFNLKIDDKYDPNPDNSRNRYLEKFGKK